MRHILLLAGASAAFALASSADAAVVGVTSFAALGANDSINWGQLTGGGTYYMNYGLTPQPVVSVNGRVATVFNPETGYFSVDTTGGAAATSLSSGSPGVTHTTYFDRSDLTIRFASPVRGAGAYLLGDTGNYTATVTATGGSPGSFSVTGHVGQVDAKGQLAIAPFAGILSDQVDITSVTFSAIDQFGEYGVGVFPLALNTTPPPPPPPPVAAVPEPASWTLLAAGLGMVGGYVRGRRRVAV